MKGLAGLVVLFMAAFVALFVLAVVAAHTGNGGG